MSYLTFTPTLPKSAPGHTLQLGVRDLHLFDAPGYFVTLECGCGVKLLSAVGSVLWEARDCVCREADRLYGEHLKNCAAQSAAAAPADPSPRST